MIEKKIDTKSIVLIFISLLMLSSLLSVIPATAQEEEEKVFVGAWPYLLPPVGHFNSYVSKNLNLGIYYDLMHMPMGMYYWANDSWLPLLATDWSFDPVANTFTVTLREGVEWSDGNAFTAADVVSTFYIGYLQNWAIWKYIDSVTAPSDTTVVFHMSKPSNLIERYVIRERVRPYATFGNFSDEVRNLLAEGKTREDNEMQWLNGNLTEYRPEEMIVTGPFMIDPESITEAEIALVKNEASWLAETVPFDKVRLYNGETAQVTPYVLAKEVEYATHGFPAATLMQFLELGIRVQPADCGLTRGLYFNYTMYPLNITEVRQAFAYAIDRVEAASVVAPAWLPQGNTTYCAPFTDAHAERWIVPEYLDEMNHYEHNLTKAAEILTNLNFTKDTDGVWMTPDGVRLEYEMITPGEFVDVTAITDNIAEQLRDFGIYVEVRSVTYTEHLPLVREGSFEITLAPTGAAHPHPFFSMHRLYEYNYVGLAPEPGMNFPMEQNTTRELPYGDAHYINFTEEIFKSAEGLDVEEQKKHVTRFALAFNELLPIIPIWHRISGNPILEDVRVTGWLPEDDPIYKNNPYVDSFVIIMMLRGILQPVVEEVTPPPGPDYTLYAGVAVVVIIIIVAAVYFLRKR